MLFFSDTEAANTLNAGANRLLGDDQQQQNAYDITNLVKIKLGVIQIICDTFWHFFDPLPV